MAQKPETRTQWRSTGPKFYAGKAGESPWNNDLHQKHTLENENHFFHLLDTNGLKFQRERHPFNLTLEEVVNDESTAKKFAVRQTNGIMPRCTHRSEPNTGRRLSDTVMLMRETNSMLANAIPELARQVQSTNQRIERLETIRSQRSSVGARSRRMQSAPTRRPPTGRSTGPIDINTGGNLGDRATYTPGKNSMRSQLRRAQSAVSVRSGMSSVLDGARDVLGKATNVLDARPQTAKTTKTILSHRNRHGWSSQLRDGDIVKHAGSGIPRRNGYDHETDHSSGKLRKRVVKVRPSTAPGVRQPSCRMMPGYKAPHEDYVMNPAPGEGSANPSFYVRPEDLGVQNPGHTT